MDETAFQKLLKDLDERIKAVEAKARQLEAEKMKKLKEKQAAEDKARASVP